MWWGSVPDFWVAQRGTHLFNRQNISYTDFVKWLESVWDEKVSDVKVKDLGNFYSLSFKMKGEKFDLDFIDED